MNYLYRITLTLTLTAGLLFACSKEGEKSAAFPDSLVDDEEIVRIGDTHVVIGRDLRVFTMIYQPMAEDSVYSRMYNLQLLNGYIDRLLLWQDATAQAIVIDDSTTRWYVDQFIQSTGRNKQSFYGVLDGFGITERDVIETVNADLVVRRFIEGPMASAIEVSDDDVRSFYDQNPERFAQKDSVRARHIILRGVTGESEEDKARKRADLEKLRRRVQAGEDFADLARKVSEGPSASRGGDLGYFSATDMVGPFSDAAFSLEPGEVSGVVETTFGYHIIKVEDRKAAREVTFEDVAPQIRSMMQQQRLGAELEERLRRNRQAAIVEPLFDFGGLTQRESATFTR